MLLTLENIQNQQFNQRFRGYDMGEVDAFLDKCAESYLFATTENLRLKEELSALKKTQSRSQEEEQSFKNAIISAQSFADDIKLKAEAHATRLQEDAKDKSTAILEDAQIQVNTLHEEITLLSGEKERLKEELRAFLNSYLNRIEDDTYATPDVAPPVAELNQNPHPELPDVEELKLERETSPQEDHTDADEGDDVAILYEKIALNDDFTPQELDEDAEESPALEMGAAPDNGDFPADELDDLDMPDLDGDMLYSLDDPLDNPGPAVVIDPLDDIDK